MNHRGWPVGAFPQLEVIKMTTLFLENISKVQATINQAQGKLEGFQEKAQAQKDKIDDFARERTIWAMMATGNDKGKNNPEFWNAFKEICGSEGTRNWTRTFCKKLQKHNPDIGFHVGSDAEIKATHKNLQSILDELEIKTVKDMKNYMAEVYELSDIATKIMAMVAETSTGKDGFLMNDQKEKFYEDLLNVAEKHEKKNK